MSQQDAAPGKKRGLTRPIEVVRAELLKDPDTKRIAKAVGMELEAYVELVLQYAQDKDKEPELAVVSDEELRRNGFNPLSAEEAADILIKGMKGELPGSVPDFDSSKFVQDKGGSGKPSLSASQGQAPTGPQDPAAQKALQDQLKRGGSGGNRA